MFSQASVSHSVHMRVSISVCLEGLVCLRDGYLRGLVRSMCGPGVDMSGWELVCPGQGSYVRPRVGKSR